jgi:hypothetical protein
MALANQSWKDDPRHRPFAERWLPAGREVYELGRAKEGVQQGNSYRAPYRYVETTWADDMEWGAAELYRATREKRYLAEAKHYARLAGAEGWMGQEQTKHYQYYPFMNIGHFRLYDLVDHRFKALLAGYYREGIEKCLEAGRKNPYRVGVPFIWCSNNLTVALATQCLLYELMTGDKRYRDFADRQRDWLLGRNPWGYTMFTGIGTVSPKSPHLMTMESPAAPFAAAWWTGRFTSAFSSPSAAAASPNPTRWPPSKDPRFTMTTSRIIRAMSPPWMAPPRPFSLASSAPTRADSERAFSGNG